MVKTLEAIKGGGGSIRVGTTGTIGALMTREMESAKSSMKVPVSSQDRAQKAPVSVPRGVPTSKKLQMRKTSDGASSSGSSSNIDCRRIDCIRTEIPRKTRSQTKSTHRVPMLASDNITLERTHSRDKTEKKVSNIVEIVDIKCGHPDRAWSTPITNRLKKLSFSKLSESVV